MAALRLHDSNDIWENDQHAGELCDFPERSAASSCSYISAFTRSVLRPQMNPDPSLCRRPMSQTACSCRPDGKSLLGFHRRCHTLHVHSSVCSAVTSLTSETLVVLENLCTHALWVCSATFSTLTGKNKMRGRAQTSKEVMTVSAHQRA